jgi:hypothetical protein
VYINYLSPRGLFVFYEAEIYAETPWRLYVVSTRRGGGYVLVEDRPSAVQPMVIQPMVRRPGDTYEAQLIIAREITQRDKTSEASTATEVVGYVKSKVFNHTSLGCSWSTGSWRRSRRGRSTCLCRLPVLCSTSSPIELPIYIPIWLLYQTPGRAVNRARDG